jgi:Xaa-Pro dipeptidase
MALAFSNAEYGERIDHVQSALLEAGLDALVVTSPENICYLSGFWTPGYHVFQAMVVRKAGDPFLVVRNIELDNLKTKAWVDRYYLVNNLDLAIETFIEALRAETVISGRVGLEVDGARQAVLRSDILSQALPDISWVPTFDIVDRFRAVKSDAEIAYIRQAVEIAEGALLAGATAIPSSATDSDVAAAVAGRLAGGGSEFTGSPPYVVAGPASALTHAVHAGRPLKAEEPIWLEVSASVQRYHGVSSRIGATDRLPESVLKYSDVSAAALTAMVAAMRPGGTAGSVDAAGRAVIDKAGMADLWKNRAAYSLGLSFPPGLGEGHIIDIKPNDQRLLKAGMVFHMIPILKVPGVGSIACTDTVLVTEDGGERLGKLDLVPLIA